MPGKDLKHYHAVATLESVATSVADVHHDVGYIWNKTDQHVAGPGCHHSSIGTTPCCVTL